MGILYVDASVDASVESAIVASGIYILRLVQCTVYDIIDIIDTSVESAMVANGIYIYPETCTSRTNCSCREPKLIYT